MSEIFITVADVMSECNIENDKEFQRILSANKIFISRNRDDRVEVDTARNIVKRLTGRKLNHKKYRQIYDRSDSPPAKLNDEACRYIEQFIPGLQAIDEGLDNGILAIAIGGGYLIGVDADDDCFIPFQSGVNFLIGERGSGKSTALSLAGILYESLSEEAVSMVRTLLSQTSDATVKWRRIFKILDRYSVDRVTLFFVEDGHAYSFYVCKSLHIMDFARVSISERTVFQAKDQVSMKPILTVRQGEVQRVTDNNIEAMNEMLDGLFPDLYESRRKLVNMFQQLSIQYENFKPEYQVPNANVKAFNDLIAKRTSYIRQLVKSNDFGSDESLESVKDYLTKSGSETWLNIDLPLGKFVRGGLATFVAYTHRLTGAIPGLLEQASELAAKRVASINSVCIPDETEEDGTPDSAPDLYDDYDADPDEQDGAFARMLDISDPTDKQLRSIGIRIVKIIEGWGSRINRIADMYCSPLVPVVNPALASLMSNYQKLLSMKMDCLRLQQNKCELVSRLIESEQYYTHISTEKINSKINELQHAMSTVDQIFRSSSYFDTLTLGDYSQHRHDAGREHSKFVALMKQFLRNMEAMFSTDEIKTLFIYDRISVQHRQGNSLRDFDRLSFGQRSGILLKILLHVSDRKIIIMDQPEDNLDTKSIIQMIIPSIRRLAGRQVLIATHNANLVMGMPESNLIAMQSSGEHGGVRCFGGVKDEEVIQAVLDILEGGEAALLQKISLYKIFTNYNHVTLLQQELEQWKTVERKKFEYTVNKQAAELEEQKIFQIQEFEQWKAAEHNKFQQYINQQVADFEEEKRLHQQELQQWQRERKRFDYVVKKQVTALEEERLHDQKLEKWEIAGYSNTAKFSDMRVARTIAGLQKSYSKDKYDILSIVADIIIKFLSSPEFDDIGIHITTLKSAIDYLLPELNINNYDFCKYPDFINYVCETTKCADLYIGKKSDFRINWPGISIPGFKRYKDKNITTSYITPAADSNTMFLANQKKPVTIIRKNKLPSSFSLIDNAKENAEVPTTISNASIVTKNVMLCSQIQQLKAHNTICSVTGMEFVFVKGGTFQMGNGTIDAPLHDVTGGDLHIGKYQVTQAEWIKVMGYNPSIFKADRNPVEHVSWDDCQVFIQKLNQQSGKQYRLPTEAEWEYACRSGGKQEKYSGSDNINLVAWFKGNGAGVPKPVGQKQPNGLGIYDMSGNVWEWCYDWYDHNYYKNGPSISPTGPLLGISRILRGGCIYSKAHHVESAYRAARRPDYRSDYLGFRLAYSSSQ